MMKERGLGIVGAIVAMVIAGLIVSGIIYYGPSILSGIQGGKGTNGGAPNSETILSVIEVREHASLYLGKEITVEGYWVSYVSPVGLMADTVPAQSLLGVIATEGGTGLISGGKYRVTGILGTSPTNTTALGMANTIYGVSVYLEVTKVEPM